jgi:GDP-4-dehydro-6-deoxy-D-mannose reductase
MFQERVLVTGIAGFVGRYLAKLLTAAGCCVFGTVLSSAEVPSDRPIPGVDLLECRLEDREQVDRVVADTRPSIVYHLAAQSSV